MSNNQSNNNHTSRIYNKEVQFGESYVLPIEQSKVTLSQAKVKKIMEDTDAKAQQIISAAENRAQIIIQTANTEATRIIEEARKKGQAEYDSVTSKGYEEGFAKGEQYGLEKFNNDAKEGLDALETLASTTFDMKKNILDSANRDIVELVNAIAEKVCHTKFNPQMLQQLTTDAIKLLNDKESITIIVSPKLVDYVQKMVPTFRSSIQNLQSLKILEDSSLSADGVIVETPSIRLDSRISSQIGELAQKMLTGGSNGMGQK